MTKHPVADIRNVTLVGHGASGKTTLADLLLFKSGVGNRAGSVDDGTSALDVDDDEKERKSSISSTMIHFDHEGRRINLIDTPGYPDFIGQVLGAMTAVENAIIVVNAHSGIEVNTRRCFRRAGENHLGRIVVINKCDTENIDYELLLAGIQETFGECCIPLNLPVGLGSDFQGVVSTLNVPETIPDNVPMDVKHVNQMLMDAIAESDENLIEKYLEGEPLTTEEIEHGFEHAIATGHIIPVLHTSATQDVGVDELREAIVHLGVPPDDIEHHMLDNDGNEIEIAPDSDGPFVAQVFKNRIDPFVAKISYVRVFSGSISKDTSVKLSSGKSVKIHQLLKPQASQQDAIDDIGAGDIFAVVKMEELKVGDTLLNGVDDVRMPAIKFPQPMIGLAIEPKSQSDQQKISGALHKVEEEDQTFGIYRDPQTKELVVQGVSELHLQIILERMHRRDKVEVVTHQPKIPYRETVGGMAEGMYRHKKQSGGSGQFAEVHFRIQSLPHDIDPEEYFTKDRFESMREYHYDPKLNYAFIDRVTGGSVPNNFIPAVEKGVRERMEKGVIAGFQVQDCVCELFFGKDHPVDSNETAFKTAASLCFREVFQQAKPSLLEPIVAAEVTVPDDKLGDITSDLNSRRGRVEGMDGIPGGFQVIHAKVPLSEVMTYARSLSSMTGGQGSFTMEFSHYDMVPPNEQSKIVAAAQMEEEEDH